ncbi:MAG: glycosyltransferase, partial [Gemmatimonadales bacterium]
MTVAFFIDRLARGGAERSVVGLADALVDMGFTVWVVTLESPSLDDFPVSEPVRREALDLLRTGGGRVRRWITFVGHLRKFLRRERPDVLISFTDRMNLIAVVASLGGNVPLILAERNDPRLKGRWCFLALGRRVLYRFADLLVVQTESVRDWFADHLTTPPLEVIPNAVWAAPGAPASEAVPPRVHETKPFKVVALGRLFPQKGFDLLIEAAAILRREAFEFELHIAGDGPERERLESLIGALNVTGVVHLVGEVNEPLVFLRSGDLFVLSSRYEGFPNALLEAMAVGLPVVATA